ncbi:MAG: glycine zipper 2TM domain-containing protein [Parvibaculum sp.]|nr:glycine zipper 2TM domain-containing protein [Parvibaculum sp.]
MTRHAQLLVGSFCILLVVAGCQATGENHRANVYKAGEVNSVQKAKTVNILAVMPAKIEVDNSKQKQSVQVFGALLGAVAGGVVGHSLGDQSATNTTIGAAGGAALGAAGGSLVPDAVLVDGISITYELDLETFNSAQVGALCEFVPGRAVMVSTSEQETRIQPNAVCPEIVQK